MRELNKKYVYSLEDLTDEEYRILYNWLLENDKGWEVVSFKCFKNNNQGINLKRFNDYWGMCSQKATHNAKELFYTLENVQPHYDNTNGSIYKFCNDQKLNSWEFDIIKRVVRCRKKGLFKEDLQKTKDLIDLYLKEFEDEK